MAIWMLYASAVGCLGWGCGVAAEHLVDRFPRRWIWTLTLIASVVVPLGIRAQNGATPGGPPVGAVRVADGGAGGGAALVSQAAASGIDYLLAALWLVASVGGIVFLARSALILRRHRCRWRRTNVAGVAVYVSDVTGPAVVGFLRGEIVVPKWVLELDEAAQRLLLAHERQHVRAGDPGLLLAGLLMVVVFPWNVAIWAQWRRLREAVELDCDRRVLGYGVDADRYLRLLLDAADRAAGRPLGTLSLAVSAPPLERRIRVITGVTVPARGVRSVVIGGFVPLLAATAFHLPTPGLPDLGSIASMGRNHMDAAAMASAGAQYPAARPELLNRHEVPSLIARSYPAHLRSAGIGGTAIVGVYLLPSGSVASTSIVESSGVAELDDAAIHVAGSFRFLPARVASGSLGSWTQLPITFVPPSPAITDPPSDASARLAIWTTAQPSVIGEGPTR